MKASRLVFFAVFLAVLSLVAGILPAAAGALPQDCTSLVVKLVDGLTPAQQTAVISRIGGTETSSVSALRLHVISVQGQDLSTVLQNLQSDAQVQSFESNKTRKAEGMPNDVSYSTQWALSKIGWESLFGTVTPAGSATVALLDTGVDASHPDLADSLVPGTSILDGGNGQSDPNGHGTMMAGILAAQTGNEIGIAGVAYQNVRVMPVTVLDSTGVGQDSDIISGIVYAADHGADVILMAFSNSDFSQNLQDAIDYAWSKGAVLVAATGNSGLSIPTFPAGDRGVVGVSATDEGDLLLSGSNTGQDVFLAAPGSNIYTTSVGGKYAYVSGTSASSAVAAGVAAIMKAVDPTLTNGVIVNRLAKSADSIGTAGDPNNQTMFGNGRINMANALADSTSESIQPAGSNGGGGPFVGPYIAAAGNASNGDGTMDVSPASAVLASTSNDFIFTFSAPNSKDFPTGSQATIQVPTGWTAPSGHITISKGSCSSASVASTSGMLVTINMACTSKSSFTVNYANVTVPSTAGTASFITKTKSGSGGTLIAIGTSPTVNVVKQDQSIGAITFSPTSINVEGNPATASATATSGLTVTFSSLTPAVCSVSITNVTAVTAGTCTIAANQAGNSLYNPAPQVTQNLTIGKGTQAALTVTGPSAANFGDPDAAITTSGGSGTGAVTFDAGNSTACSVVSGKLHVTAGTGNCAITATKAADANYNSATSTAAAVTIGKANSSVTVTGTTSFTYSGSPQGPDAATVTGSTGAVTYSYVGTGTTSYSASSTKPTAAGSYTVTATVAADANYNGAFSSPVAFNITPASLTVTANNATRAYGAANPALTVSFQGFANGDDASKLTSQPGVSTAADATSPVGSYDIVPSGGASGNYTFNYVKGSLSITKAAQDINFAALPDKAYGDAPFTVGATATSGLPVGFSIVSGPASISGNTIVVNGLGPVTVKAGQGGNGNYGAASDVTQTFNVQLGPPNPPSVTSAGSIASGTFTLTWKQTGLAGSTYALDYSSDGGATWTPAYNGSNNWQDFFQFPNGSYIFRAKAMNGAYSSGWATTGTYTVTQSLSTPGVPVATSAGSIATGTFTMTWRPTGLAGSTYELDYSPDGGTTWIPGYNGTNTWQDFFQFPNGTYIFRVKAMNGGASSGWATTGSLTVTQSLSVPGVPVATSAGSIASGTFTLSWRPTGLAGSTYELDYSSDGGNTWIQSYNGPNPWQDFFQFPNGTYIFRVKAMNGGNSTAWVTTGGYTVSQSLSAPGVPVATSAGTISSGTFTLSWRPTGLAGSIYELDYSSDGGITWLQAYSGSNTYSDFFQFQNGTYLFRVKAMNGGSSSGWSTTSSYTVTQSLSTPGTPVASSTSNISSGTFTLAWRPTGLAGSTYELDYSSDGGFTWIPYYTGLNTYRGFSQLPNGTYMFRVKAMNGGASSGWATTVGFTVSGS